MSAVRLDAVSKAYGTTSVLEGVELDVPRGCFAAVLGPSGCGKTTLLRLIAGFERPDRGRVWLGDRLVDDGRTRVPAERRGIGYVPQEGLLFPHLDVAGNVAFGLPLRERRSRARTRVAELLELVGLSGLEHRRPYELSGGQQQRVALARSLAPRPSVLLLDEPFAALDAGLRETVREDFKQILAGVGATVVSSHDQEEALSLADVVAVLRDGRIVQAGTPQEIYGRPATAEVARFLGEANLVAAISDGTTATSAVGTLALAGGGAPAGTRILVLIRPEQIALLAPADAAPDAPQATVCDTTYYGHDAVVTLALSRADGPERLVARTSGDLAPRPRQRVALAFRGEMVALSG